MVMGKVSWFVGRLHITSLIIFSKYIH